MKPKQSFYTVVENAGYEGERDIRSFPNLTTADRWITKHYGQDEIESLHVLIRRDSDEGRTYEY